MCAAKASTSELNRFMRAKLDGTEPMMKAVIREKIVKPRSDIMRQGDIPKVAHILLDGHTYRYRLLSDGRRQITAVLVPGDLCDLEAVMRGRADYSVSTLSHCILGEIPAERVTKPSTRDPEMTQALWRHLLRDEAISRERLVSMGRRSALERVAHFLCELRTRLEAVDLASDVEFQIQFTQLELADILGLSAVHVNRTLQELRRIGLIALVGGTLTILDVSVLQAVAGFNADYLQMT